MSVMAQSALIRQFVELVQGEMSIAGMPGSSKS